MRTLLLAGTSLLALAASLATASATPVPLTNTIVGTTTLTAPSAATYDITAIGAQGGHGGSGNANPGGGFFDTGTNPMFSFATLAATARSRSQSCRHPRTSSSPPASPDSAPA
jgi:hypothetical protein